MMVMKAESPCFWPYRSTENYLQIHWWYSFQFQRLMSQWRWWMVPQFIWSRSVLILLLLSALVCKYLGGSRNHVGWWGRTLVLCTTPHQHMFTEKKKNTQEQNILLCLLVLCFFFFTCPRAKTPSPMSESGKMGIALGDLCLNPLHWGTVLSISYHLKASYQRILFLRKKKTQ